ncbi:MAG: PQQ-binding-like beta-propeller repeat protein [Pseudomonadota bacterium]
MNFFTLSTASAYFYKSGVRKSYTSSFSPSLTIVSSILCAIFATGCTSVSKPLGSNDRSSSAVIQSSKDNNGLLRQEWSISAPQKEFVSPAISGNTLLALENQTTVRAINLTTGNTQWTKDFGSTLQGALSANAEHLLATSTRGEVILADVITGTPVWKHSINYSIQGVAQFLPDSLACWTTEGNVILISKKDGTRQWVYTSPASLLLQTPRTGTFALGAIFTGTPKGKLVVLDVSSGHAYWQATVGNSGKAKEGDPLLDTSAIPPIINGAYACTAHAYRTACFDRLKGTPVWSSEIGTLTGFESDGLNLYATSPSGIIFSLSAKNGKIEWQNNEFKNQLLFKPELAENFLWVALKNQPSIIQIDTATGRVVNTFTIPAPAMWIKAIDDNSLLVQTQNGRLVRYNISLKNDKKSGSTR